MLTTHITRGAAIAAMIALAGPASALSCMPPDLDRSFQHAAEAEEGYGLFYGDIEVDKNTVPQFRGNPQPYTAEGIFRGQAVYANGLSPEYVQPITIEVECMGMWCGSAYDVDDAILFVELDDQGEMTLEIDACPQWVFHSPAEADLEKMIALIAAIPATIDEGAEVPSEAD
jgi:hypothetical protein